MKMPRPRYLVLHNFLPSWKGVQPTDCNLIEAFALSNFVFASTSGVLGVPVIAAFKGKTNMGDTTTAISNSLGMVFSGSRLLICW